MFGRLRVVVNGEGVHSRAPRAGLYCIENKPVRPTVLPRKSYFCLVSSVQDAIRAAVDT
jgi:hypothetical protein